MDELFTIQGSSKLRAALQAAGPLARDAMAAAMVQEQEQIMAAAKILTPVDTGVLRASGTVLPPVVAGNQIEVVSGFGGAASAYAVPVHERLGAVHKTGQAKFLEQPFLAATAGMGSRLAARVAAALGRLRAA